MNSPLHIMNGAAHRRGFSLIEVLMAVLILGLGLLGLGAIMPVVVKQQRMGADQTGGTIAAQSALAIMQGGSKVDNGFWRRWVTTLPPGTPLIVTGASASNPDQWQNLIPEDGSWMILRTDPNTNRILLGRDGGRTINNNNNRVFTEERAVAIPMADRLFPSASAGMGEPQFVWDAAVRRMGRRDLGANPPTAERGWDRVQVAVFVRRIDSRVQLNRGGGARTLYQAMSDSTLGDADRKWPVARDEGTGEPTLDGNFAGANSYSEPVRLRATFSPAADWPRDRIIVDTDQGVQGGNNVDTEVLDRNILQPGQMFVDNLGNVYTVVGLDTRVDDPHAVRVTPPVPAGVDATDNNNTQSLREIVATLQIPAAVVVQVINP